MARSCTTTGATRGSCTAWQASPPTGRSWPGCAGGRCTPVTRCLPASGGEGHDDDALRTLSPDEVRPSEPTRGSATLGGTMKRLLSTSISLLAVVGMLGAPVPASAGVAPSNDLIGDATAIGALPYTDTIDTRL